MRTTIVSPSTLLVTVAVSGCAGVTPQRPCESSAADLASERAAVEATVRAWEQAYPNYDNDRAHALQDADARYVEGDYPRPMWPVSKVHVAAKEANVRITYRLRDLSTRIEGNVAWVTLTNQVAIDADSDAARALLATMRDLFPTDHDEMTFVESAVLVKRADGWKIAFMHSTLLPPPKKHDAEQTAAPPPQPAK